MDMMATESGLLQAVLTGFLCILVLPKIFNFRTQQMASQVGQNHPKFEGWKVVSAVVMPPQAHWELQGKPNKQNKTCSGR